MLRDQEKILLLEEYSW